jgi:hypothetical protein
MHNAQSLPSRYARQLAAVALLAVVASIAGCTPFSNFRQQCACAARRPAVDPAGCWAGSWQACTSSHKGCLDAIITNCDNTQFNVRFHATFFKVFSYEYEITLTAYEQDGVWHFHGQKDLGKLAGGMYYYDGTVTATDFRATYRTCKDNGVFVMCRQTCDCCCR